MSGIPRFGDRSRTLPAMRKAFLISRVCEIAAELLLLGGLMQPANAQDARWYQLSEQVVQLQEKGRAAEAIPPAQEAVHVAEATYGPQDRHLGLSLNVLGVLFEEVEKFADADATLRRALDVMTRTSGAESRDAASVLGNLGELYRLEGSYPQAEQFTQQALSIQEKVLAPNDQHIATSANNLALIYVSEGKYADAEPLYRRAMAIDEKLVGPGNRELAADFTNLGDLESKRGKDAEAEPLFAQALSIDLKILGNSHPQIAQDLSNLANAYLSEGKFAGAESLFQRALAIDLSAEGENSATAAAILEGMGALYHDEGRYADSEAAYTRALANREKALGPDHPDVALILDNLASAYAGEGRYSDAEKLYRTAIAIREKKLGPMHPSLALTMINLADLYSTHGRWGEAEALYRNAMTIYLKAYGQQDIRVADLLRTAGSLMIDEGKLADAERVLMGAVAISEKAKGPNDPAVALNLNLLAETLEYQGQHANAETLYKRAVDIGEKALPPNSSDLADYRMGLAWVYENEGKFADAEPLFRQGITTLQANLGANSPHLGETQMSLAVFYYAWDKPDLAEPYFEKRLGNLMAQFRANAATMSEKDRLIFLATTPGAFPLFYSFVLKYHDRDPALAGKMYDALLQEKGFIAESAAALRAGIEASGDKEALAMLDNLAAEKTQLAALVESTVGDPADRRAQIAQLEQQANQLEQELARRSSAVSEQKTFAVVTWRDVQKGLKPGEAAVEIARFQLHDGKSFRDNQLYVALVVKPDSKNPDLIFLGDSRELETAPMSAYRAEVAQTRGLTAEAAPGAPGTDAGAGNTSAAYNGFWKPLEPALAGVKRVYVSPDGVLNQIPFGLFTDSAGKLIIEKYELRYVNSTKDLLRQRRSAQTRSAVLVGNPRFDLSEAQQRAALVEIGKGSAQPGADPAASAQRVQVASRAINLSGGPLNPLPGTQAEVDAVAKLLAQGGWQTATYTGDRALKATMVDLRSPRVVHIATHGFFLPEAETRQQSRAGGAARETQVDPMLRSGLLFAGADRVRSGTPSAPGLDDGVLTAFEASQLRLEGTELVVLSACETGLGEQSNSEGVFGLRRGLQEAGAEAVMMSMWSVPDRETQELMALFYAKWLGGLDKPEALRQAQFQEREVVRKRYGTDLPYYWGAFVLVSR
jgi:CHAT domain-containing protein/Tfp pilus assembly protein PilF